MVISFATMVRLLILAAMVPTVASAQDRSSTKPRTASLHLAETGEDISVSVRPVDRSGFEGFRTIRVMLRGKEQVITSRMELACFNPPGANGIYPGLPVAGLQSAHDSFFFVGHYGRGAAAHTVLIFEGWGYASSAAAMLAIGFHDDGTAYKILELDEFDPSSFQERSDGTAVLIGSPSLSEVISRYADRDHLYATTYDPSAAYSFRPNQRAVYSLLESRAYNTEHYAWAGPHMSDKLAVILDPAHRQKPRVVPVSRLDREFTRPRESAE